MKQRFKNCYIGFAAHTFTFFFLILNEFDDKTRNFARVLNLLANSNFFFFIFKFFAFF